MIRTSSPVSSASSSGSHSRPQSTLITFQPAPRKEASNSCTILPLPRTGPSSRCKLQLITKVRLRSEEHTSELQSRGQLVCRLLLENKYKFRFITKLYHAAYCGLNYPQSPSQC